LTFNLQKWKRKARALRGAARRGAINVRAPGRGGALGGGWMRNHGDPSSAAVSLLRPQPSVRLLVRAPAILDSSADQFTASSSAAGARRAHGARGGPAVNDN